MSKITIGVCPVCDEMTLLKVLDHTQQETLRQLGAVKMGDTALECQACSLVFNKSQLKQKMADEGGVREWMKKHFE
jgi:hypothetical protein